MVFQRARGEYVHIQRQEFGVADFLAVTGFVGDKAVGLILFEEGFHIQAVFIVDGDIDGRNRNNFRTGFVRVVARVIAHIAKALNGVGCAFHVFAEFFQGLDGGEIHAVTRCFSARQRAAEFDRFAGEHARRGFFNDVFVSIDHPRHDFAVGVHIGGGNIDFFADERRNGFGVSTGNAFQLCFGIITRIQGNATFAAAVRNACDTAFDGHPNRQSFDFVKIYIGMETYAAFVGADGVVVLRTVAGEGFDCAVIEFDGEADFQGTLRVFQDFIHRRVSIKPVAGGFHLFAGDFERIQGFFCSRLGHFSSFSCLVEVKGLAVVTITNFQTKYNRVWSIIEKYIHLYRVLFSPVFQNLFLTADGYARMSGFNRDVDGANQRQFQTSYFLMAVL